MQYKTLNCIFHLIYPVINVKGKNMKDKGKKGNFYYFIILCLSQTQNILDH